MGDTFNAGETASGVITGPRNLLDTIAHDRSLEVTRGTPPDARLQRCFPQLQLDLDSNEENLERGDQADDETSVFYLRPATGKIYFVRRSG